MFKLQRLEITGFKSFADYTELVFTGNGITAIVGPNGCGKSNVADAISWVLGEQKVKNLRGGEMKDVIFQGSKNRLPSGMAEVVLHMVRDETVEEEPDIDDIDATLEELDDQAGAVEERLAPELTAGEAEAQTPPDASASVVATADVAHATAHEASASTNEATDVTAAAPEASGDATTVAVVEAEVVESPSLEADAQKSRGSKSRAHQHKRHWRPRRLGLDFAPGEVVSVTRRLYRDGESEYLLNGRVCRLRDIQDLFSGTGLSGAHYAIVEQGRIGQILSAKPMDRRTLIEEAAGITKFRVRQRAAEARLEAARTNLSRVSDIISEIERQVGSLRRQAAKARRYHQLREELRELLRKVYAADEHTLTARLEELRENLAAANDEVERFATELEEREEDARRATGEAREREEELAAERAVVSESALRFDRRERERTYQGEQIAALERRLEEIRREAETVSSRIASVTAESESLTLRDVQMREETEATARQLQEAEETYARRAAEVVEAESAIESARGELLTHTAAAERLSEIGRQLETVLEKLSAQAEGLAREGERAAAAHEQAKAEAAKLQEEIGAARTHLNALHSEREARSRELSESRAEVAAAAAEHARVRDESARVRHRLDTLAEIDTQHSLYSRAVQRLFSPAETDAPKDFHVVATLADFLRVEPRWERAVEGVFGPHLQSVIVPTPDDALRAAAWLQATGAGRATFLVAGLQGGAGLEESDEAAASVDVEGVADRNDADRSDAGGVDAGSGDVDLQVASLLGAPRELAAVLNRTLAREMGARVIPSLERAIELTLPGEGMCVTAEGDCVIAGQLIAAGGAPVGEDGAGLLAFKREMRELEVRMVGLEADLVFADEAAKSARARLAELEDAFVLLNDEIGRVEREQVAREVSARQLQHEIERAERHIRVVADDAARLAEERREVEERRAKQLADALAAEEARAAAQRAVSEAADALAEARRAAEAESGNVGEQRAQAATAAERRRAAAAELRRMEAETAELHTRLERHEREASEGRERIEGLRRSLTELDESAAGAEGERAALERRVEEASARLTEARERADSLTQEVAELHHQASSARDARAALEVQRAESAARLNYVRESCMSELNQPLEEIAASFIPEEGFDLEASRARLEELRARVEGFGAVNMMALEELAENEERLQFLTVQRQDITDGISSTEEALREIKRRSRERFRHAFEEINRNFGQFFLELFGGGRGEMSLIDTEDVLESGIDIVAQPPGKRLQNVLLLSGGEKAMAALSLVLAIFRYRPSPFCLLDEVDAPLDEANVGRFTAKVNEMSTETQFLVITHNKRTMETARALYGVTMEEAGVSRLVSVRFD